MATFDSSFETIEHAGKVEGYLKRIIEALKCNANKAISEDDLKLESVTLVDLLCALMRGSEIPSYSELFNSINKNSIKYLKSGTVTESELLEQYIEELDSRGINHDKSKLENPEKEGYDVLKPLLKSVPYGSPEYQKYLDQMQEIVRHHYSMNSHHPEHFENGIYGMTIMDLIEMICDWKAASERYGCNDFIERIGTTSKERFKYDEPMAIVLKNTAEEYLM